MIDSHDPAGQAPAPVLPLDPLQDGERIVALDFIRGLALMGILFANITAYAQPYTAYYWPPALAGGMTAGDQAVWLFQFVFVDGKFRGLFTLLFGAGLYLFWERAEARGSGAGLLVRRLLVLLAFGLAHYLFLWRGDILTLYAVWGLVAVPMLGWERHRQLGAGLMLCLAGGLLMALMWGGSLSAPQPGLASIEADVLAQARAETALFSHGSYARILAFVIDEELPGLVRTLVIVGMTETLGLILLGMAAYRYGLFSGALDPVRLRRWGWAALLVGWAASLALGLWPVSRAFPYWLTIAVFNGFGPLPHFLTVCGLLALLAPGAARASRGWLGRRIVAAGRMAFTNYIGLSAVAMLAFHGWALGGFGRFDRVELLAFVAGGWLLMLAWSPAWLAAFRFGPLEWLWRCLTYGQRVPLRR